MRITTTPEFIDAIGRIVETVPAEAPTRDQRRADALSYADDFAAIAEAFSHGDDTWFDDFRAAAETRALADPDALRMIGDARDRVGAQQVDSAFAQLFAAGTGSSALDSMVPSLRAYDSDLTAEAVMGIGAAVLFGLAPWEYVPYHDASASSFLRRLGTEPWPIDEPSDRYEQVIGALAILLRVSRQADGPLRDLVDAQIAVDQLMR